MYGIFTSMNGWFFYGFHVGKSANPMDPMVLAFKLFPKHRETISDLSRRYQSFQALPLNPKTMKNEAF